MPQFLQITTSPEAAANGDALKREVSKILQVAEEAISSVQIRHRTLDARHGVPKIALQVGVYLHPEEFVAPTIEFRYKNVAQSPPVIIVGAGPAGLFAALKLLERGLRPVIIERGKNVSARKRDVVLLAKQHRVNPNSNWCFGEGGAGTFSDGKLYTRSNKRGNIEEVLLHLVEHGASPAILTETHAHIGTDKLSAIMERIRNTVEQHGGSYIFDTQVADLLLRGGKVAGVKDAQGNTYEGIAVILAAGHSARELYQLFAGRRWALEAKPFAMGLRVEHPQETINQIQYHQRNYSSCLPAASYSLAAQVAGRGVFSFCVCPGGLIVPATTAAGLMVVNGMSNSQRNSPFTNAGIVVQVQPGDYSAFEQHGVLAGLKLQESLEQRMSAATGGAQTAPAQRLTDFVNGKLSSSLNPCSCLTGVAAAPLHELLPRALASGLQEAFKLFDKKMHGFLTSQANVVGVESRTSAPVRIPRLRETFQHPQLPQLYPCGEGAGYAGGITSSAMDGINCAALVEV